MIPGDASRAPFTEGEGWFSTQDGTRLFCRWSRPRDARGLALVVHGMTEHSGRYTPLRDALCAAITGFTLSYTGGSRDMKALQLDSPKE